MLNRRAFISAAGAALSGVALAAEPPRPRGIPLKLEPLEYDFDALEPFLSAACLRHHYEVYHADCLARLHQVLAKVNLNVANLVSLMPSMQRLVEPPDDRRSVLTLSRKPGTLPDDVVQDIRKYGGAHVNHTAFWRFLSPPGKGPSAPRGRVAQALQKEFGGIDDFKRAFTEAALDHFGSGWAWLSYRHDGKLIISTTSNEDNPLMSEFVSWQDQGKPILCLDLWEHSYCARYRNDRRKYIAAWWKVVNWSFVDRAYGIVTARS
ncbi:MAG TPA: superoxide dismutase [Prosthecobacter sp.]|nr:superoxide dismutase [Prosthecobacter sp.]